MLTHENGDALRSLDAQQRLDWQRGYQVIDPAGGSNLATTGTGAYEVDVAAGDINAGGTTVTCTAATVDLSVEVGTTPKMAVIYRDAAGAAQYEVGPAQARDPAGEDVRATFEPVAPSLYNVNGVAIAEVLLDDSVGDVTASELRDRRVPAELIVDSIDANTVSTEEANIGNVVVDQDTVVSLTSHGGTLVDVGANETQTVFDVSGTVDVVSGHIIGPQAGDLTVTWEDGSVDVPLSNDAIGHDGADNRVSVISVPPIKNASKLEFLNDTGSINTYGWEVITI